MFINNLSGDVDFFGYTKWILTSWNKTNKQKQTKKYPTEVTKTHKKVNINTDATVFITLYTYVQVAEAESWGGWVGWLVGRDSFGMDMREETQNAERDVP